MMTGASAAAEAAPARATRGEWLGLCVIALPCLLYSMDLSVLHLAAPALTRDLQPSGAELLWIVDIYGFMVAGWLVTMGTLGDRIGRRRLLMGGAAAFGVASILAASARSAETLILARALLGVAGATVAPSTLSLIRNMFHDENQRTFAISVWMTSYAAGGLIGPVVGGVLLQYFHWGSVFLIAVPVMALLLVAAPRLLPEYKDPDAGRPDVVSAALSLCAVLSVIYGLKRIAEDGVSVLALAFIAAGVLIGVVFVRRQQRLADPLIDLALFKVPAFSTALAMNLLGCLTMFGIFLLTAQYLQLVLGMSPLVAALWSLPSTLVVTASSLLAPAVVARARPAHVLAGGMTLLAIGLAMLIGIGEGGLPLLIAAQIVMCIGLGPTFVLTTDLIVGSAPPERAGAAGAISETGSEFGGVLGIAVLGSIGLGVYRTFMADALPAGLTPEVVEAARATLAGASQTAQELGGSQGAAVLAAAQAAFIGAMELTAGLCAALSFAGAVAPFFLLKDAKRGAH